MEYCHLAINVGQRNMADKVHRGLQLGFKKIEKSGNKEDQLKVSPYDTLNEL